MDLIKQEAATVTVAVTDDVEEEEEHLDDLDDTFYETYNNADDTIKAPPLSPVSPLHKLHLLGEEVQNEVEISDIETEEDDADSIISAFSNDHNYNMSPVVEPVSPISSTTDRATPDTVHTLDAGYESQLSPTSSLSEIEDMPIVNLDEFAFWNDLSGDLTSDPISDLFPGLV